MEIYLNNTNNVSENEVAAVLQQNLLILPLSYLRRKKKRGTSKGQLISKYPFGVFKLTKKPTKCL